MRVDVARVYFHVAKLNQDRRDFVYTERGNIRIAREDGSVDSIHIEAAEGLLRCV